jgi:hypothetical protein
MTEDQTHPLLKFLARIVWLNGLRMWATIFVVALLLVIFGNTLARVIGLVFLVPCFVAVARVLRRRS